MEIGLTKKDENDVRCKKKYKMFKRIRCDGVVCRLKWMRYEVVNTRKSKSKSEDIKMFHKR